MFLQRYIQCVSGQLIQYSHIGAILSASDIRQYETRLRPKLSEDTATARCHNNHVTGDKIGMTESLHELGMQHGCNNDPDLKKMYVDDVSVQTNHIENAVSGINRDDHVRQLLLVALE